MKTPDLKPCPFCGQQPRIDRYFMPNMPNVLYAVQCVNINCPTNPITQYCKDRKFIIESWNRRVTDENA